jgi:hypothetical protein
MVNCNQAAFYDFFRHLVAICAACSAFTVVNLIAFKEMTRKARIVVYTEVLISFEVAVADATGYVYAMNVFINVIFVGEFDAAIIDICGDKLFSTMTFGPKARCICDCCIWFCTNSANHTIDCLGHPVNLAFYVT